MAELLGWSIERPLFTVNDAQRTLSIERPSLREKLSRMTRRGDLTRIERGKYTVHYDPMVYASYVEVPSYVSLWSGLRFYQLTTQQPTGVQVVVAVNRPDLEGVSFHQSGRLFGFGKERYDRFEIFVADEERLLIDCLSRNQVPVAATSELLTVVDIEKTVAYAERFGRKSVMKRLGYLFDHVRGQVVEALRVRDRNYPLLDLTGPAEGEPDGDWRLRVNTNAL